MWLESHGNLARHPKTRRLMQRMGWTLPHTLGNLHLLWWWALEYAPTGDLTRFEPEQVTYDLDLGDATPEEFLRAMVEAGFLDEVGSDSAESPAVAGRDSVLKLHDWPDYTAKSLRPKYRRDPEKWHDVLRSYGRPIPVQRRRRVSTNASRNDQIVEHEPQGAVRVDCTNRCNSRQGGSEVSGSERNQYALRAVPKISSDSVVYANDAENPQVTTILPAQAETPTSDTSSFQVDVSLIPKCLAGRRNFNDWWLKLQEQYKNKGCPMTASEQVKLLALLARNPFTAVEKLQYSVVNFETTYATLLAPRKPQPQNTS